MPQRILLVTPYFPPHVGGVEYYVHNLARVLRRRLAKQVVIVTTAQGSRRVRRAEVDGMTIYRLPVVGRVSNTPVGTGWYPALRRLMASERVELVNAHAPVPLFADVAALAAGALPFVLTYHSGPMSKGRPLPDLLIGAYERLVLPRTAARADHVICCSDWVRSVFGPVFGPSVTTISPGVDLEVFRPGDRALPDRVLFVGSLERGTEYKGLDDLLRAVALLRVRRPGVRLVVVGDGDRRGSFEGMSRELGIGDAVTFMGTLAPAELAVQYQESALLVLPSRFESFGMVIAEAMACGRPVVATSVGGIPGLVADGVTGVLVPSGDVAALVVAVERVLGDERLATRLGAAGRDRVVAELSWETQADRTAAVFEQAADSRRARAGAGGRRLRGWAGRGKGRAS